MEIIEVYSILDREVEKTCDGHVLERSMARR